MTDECGGWVEGALDRLAADDVHVSAPARVRSAVLDEWDRQHALPLRGRRTDDWKARLTWFLVPAAAAAMLAIAALPRGAVRSPVSEAPAAEEVIPDDAPATSRFNRDDRGADLVPPPPKAMARLAAARFAREGGRSARRASQASPHDRSPTRLRFGDRAAEAGYVIVPAPLVDPRALHVVRARMSRMALATLGVPIVNPDADGLVEVEMLVGDDGVAQSIRHATLVSEQTEMGGQR
jgi:hypothetical protein